MSFSFTSIIAAIYDLPYFELEKIRLSLEARDRDIQAAAAKIFSYIPKAKYHDDVKHMILAYPKRINEYRNQDGDTCLHAVALTGSEDLATWFLENGADPTLTNDHNQTAYDIADLWSKPLAEILKPPKPKDQKDQKDDKDSTSSSKS